MQVEYTARKIVVTKKLKAQAEEGLKRIEKLVDGSAKIHIFFNCEKYRCSVEISLKTKLKDIAAQCVSPEAETALHDALDKIEKQVLKLKKTIVTKKRHPKGEKATAGTIRLSGDEARAATDNVKAAPGPKKSKANGSANGKLSVVTHSFPQTGASLPEPHVIRSLDSMAMRPMTLEEALKEAAYRDKDVFVFRNRGGQLLVLHRMRDGKMELIETPA
ncbi:ribosome hibernation-promoting factor, HPF/YfiA family [Terriglobus tenax]|uniref:ribosome hibernation-promoting factor, HPF/YfiA family n=1 Tax=Terriglobus tenax TaxID=1111115 RepID=UPI0021E0CD6C|nr:ribosome-associated translation inhibitor RaiA [Terriglobus tenax]